MFPIFAHFCNKDKTLVLQMASVFQNYYLSKQYRGWDKCSFLVGATRTGLSYYVCVRSLNYVVHVTIETLQTVFSLFLFLTKHSKLKCGFWSYYYMYSEYSIWIHILNMTYAYYFCCSLCITVGRLNGRNFEFYTLIGALGLSTIIITILIICLSMER